MAIAGKITFREMVDSDLDAVLATEFLSYAYPWSREIFLGCLQGSTYDCRVVQRGGEIVGHAILSVAAGESHLLNICVRRDQQGFGIGRLFVRHVIKRAEVGGAQVMFLEVRPSNKIAIGLYTSLGFAQTGRRKDYYPADVGREDALLLSLSLQQPASSEA